MKIKKLFPERPEYSDMLGFKCPACGETHVVSVGPKSYWNIRWQFNGDYEKPTINPSVLVTVDIPADVKIEPNIRRCHSFIRDGRIQFLADCTHHLAGQTVELPDYPEEEDGDENNIIFHRNTWNWGRSTIIVAHGGLAVVTVSIEDETPRVAWVSGLSVIGSSRKKGYGTELLKAAISEAERMGASEVELAAEQNTFPERWYRRFGFEERRFDEKLVILGNEIKKLK